MDVLNIPWFGSELSSFHSVNPSLTRCKTGLPKQLYVSDGGHLENLALMELLKRKTRRIVTFDGEAGMTPGSLAKLIFSLQPGQTKVGRSNVLLAEVIMSTYRAKDG